MARNEPRTVGAEKALHPVYRRRVYWATIYNAEGERLAQRGPFRVAWQALDDARALFAEYAEKHGFSTAPRNPLSYDEWKAAQASS